MYLEEVEYIQNNAIDSQEKLWEDDYYAFENAAASNGLNLKEYMTQSNVLFQGTKRIKWNSILPGVDEVLYVYGVEFSDDGSKYEPVTDIAWKLIEPEYAPLKDIDFELDIDVKGAEVSLSVKPVNYDGHYLVKYVDINNDLYVSGEDVFTDDYMSILADEWIRVYDGNLSNGYDQETILDNATYSGEQVIDTELSSYVLYSALVYAVEEYDGYVQVVSKPSYINFSTEQVQQSDMDINIEITNCYVRVADLHITPTNADESYMLLVTPTEYLPAEYDDETLISLVLEDEVFKWSALSLKGEITSHLNTLYPETEYMVIAFGYSGGVVTTDVCTKIFKTEPEGECALHIEDVLIGGPYKPSDLYNYNPERFKYYTEPYHYDSVQFVMTIEVLTSEPTTDIFAYPFTKMDYDYYGEETIFFDLLIDNCEPFEITSATYIDGPYYVCAAAFDQKGNLTPMWCSEEISWSMDDIKPIDELIERLEAGTTRAKMVIVDCRTGKISAVR